MNLTMKERAVLLAIADSEYRMGGVEENEPVWTFDCGGGVVSAAGMGGVFASLQKKGLIILDGQGKESTVVFTAAGIVEVQTQRAV
jgi:hypothetical protein